MQRLAPSNFLSGLLVWAVILLPLWVYLAFVPSFGYLQNNDYYYILDAVLDGEHFSQDPGVWLRLKTSEHLAAVPALIYAANVILNHGNNRALTVLTLVLMAVVFVQLYRHLPQEVREKPLLKTVFGLSISAFAFTGVAAHNVAMGFSGTQWFLANALALTAISLLVTHGDKKSQKWLYSGLFLCGLFGVFSYTTHLAVWPALLIGVFLLGLGRRHYAFLILLGLLFSGIFLLGFEKLSHHPEQNTRDWLTLAKYMATYFGSPFTKTLRLAKIIALLGATAAAWLHISAAFGPLRPQRRELAPWLMVQIYALGSALGTGVGRSHYGQDQALASRYATLPGLFWASLIVALALVAWRHKSRVEKWPRRALAALAVLWLVLLTATFARGLPVLENFAARASRQEVTTLMLLRGYRDARMVRLISLASYPLTFWKVRDALVALDHVPFDRALPRQPSRQIDPSLLHSTRPAPRQGYFQSLSAVEKSTEIVRVQGWAYSPEGEAEEVVLVDTEGNTHGELVIGILRREVTRSLGSKMRPVGWEGYVEAEHLLRGLRAYARWKGDEGFYPLRDGRRLEKQLEKLRELRR
jgi:hypothetical protein